MKNNKLNIEATIKAIKVEFGRDPDMMRMVTEISYECADASDEDRCEAAYKIMTCTNDAAKARAIVFER